MRPPAGSKTRPGTRTKSISSCAARRQRAATGWGMRHVPGRSSVSRSWTSVEHEAPHSSDRRAAGRASGRWPEIVSEGTAECPARYRTRRSRAPRGLPEGVQRLDPLRAPPRIAAPEAVGSSAVAARQDLLAQHCLSRGRMRIEFRAGLRATERKRSPPLARGAIGRGGGARSVACYRDPDRTRHRARRAILAKKRRARRGAFHPRHRAPSP